MTSLHNKEALFTWPDKELKNDELRSAAQMLCRDQEWRYEYTGRGRKPKIYNPDGEWVTLPLTPSSYGSVLKTIAELKRMGAVLDKIESRALRRARRHIPQTPLVEFSEPVESPWTEAEWRQQQRGQGWRERVAGLAPEPEPEPPAPLTKYAAGVLERARPQVIRDDARSDSWSLADARQMLRDGYSLDTVVSRTGWGRMWLTDLAERLARG